MKVCVALYAACLKERRWVRPPQKTDRNLYFFFSSSRESIDVPVFSGRCCDLQMQPRAGKPNTHFYVYLTHRHSDQGDAADETRRPRRQARRWIVGRKSCVISPWDPVVLSVAAMTTPVEGVDEFKETGLPIFQHSEHLARCRSTMDEWVSGEGCGERGGVFQRRARTAEMALHALKKKKT